MNISLEVLILIVIACELGLIYVRLGSSKDE